MTEPDQAKYSLHRSRNACSEVSSRVRVARQGVLNSDACLRWRGMHEFDAPDAVAAIAAGLLQHQLSGLCKPLREPLSQFLSGAVQIRVRSPAQCLRAEQDFLRAHGHDDVRVRRHPYASRRRIAEQGVQLRSVCAVLDWIDPQQLAVDTA